MYSEQFFANKKFNPTRATTYGFIRDGAGWVYTTDIMSKKFRLVVRVGARGAVTETLTDKTTGDEYILYRVENASGDFVGRVREALESKLREIADACFDEDRFKSKYAKLVISYIEKKYGDKLEFLWDKFPDIAIWRRADSKKWYALVGVLPRCKIIGRDSKNVDILNLRAGDTAVDNRRIFPAWHMNKKTWITVILDESVPIRQIYKMIDNSFSHAE